MKRHLLWTMGFDTRAHILETAIKEDWEDNVKEQWRQNKEKITEGIAAQFGVDQIEQKLGDFVALGVRPFSVVAHHNVYFDKSEPPSY